MSTNTTINNNNARPKLIKIAADMMNHRELCICGQRQCAILSNCFKSIGDARGSTYVMPSMNGSRCVGIKQFKLQRACHHLGLGSENYAKYATVDNRDRRSSNKGGEGGVDTDEKPVPAECTRSKKPKKVPKRTRKSIAVHHFHPEVVQELITDRQQVTFKDYLSDTFIRENGLWQNGYTEEDYAPTEFQPYKKRKKMSDKPVFFIILYHLF